MSNERSSAENFSLEALRARDRGEFTRVVDAYSGVIYRLVVKILQDQQDAEDVLQESFINAYRALPGFDGRSSLSTWLYRIATNEALMLLRKRRSNQVSIDEPVEGEEIEQEPRQIIDWCCLPEADFMSGEARRMLDQAVEQLSSSLKIVFLLRDIEGLSTQETGEVLNISETAVKTRLSRARLQLREILSSYYGERHHLSAEEKERA